PLFLPLVLLLVTWRSGRTSVWEERNPISVAERTFRALRRWSGANRWRRSAPRRSRRAAVRGRRLGLGGSGVLGPQRLGAAAEGGLVRPRRGEPARERNKHVTCIFSEYFRKLRRACALRAETGREQGHGGRGAVQAELAVGGADRGADHQADARPLPCAASADPLGVSRDLERHRRVARGAGVLDLRAVRVGGEGQQEQALAVLGGELRRRVERAGAEVRADGDRVG